jgi:hypothetical protein
VNLTLAESYKQNGLTVFTFNKDVTFFCEDSALYHNSTAGVVFEAKTSKQLPFYCKYSHKKLKTLDFAKIVEENRNKSCPLNFTYVPALPDPCVKSLKIGGSVEETKRFCEFQGGKIVDLSSPDSVIKR